MDPSFISAIILFVLEGLILIWYRNDLRHTVLFWQLEVFVVVIIGLTLYPTINLERANG